MTHYRNFISLLLFQVAVSISGANLLSAEEQQTTNPQDAGMVVEAIEVKRVNGYETERVFMGRVEPRRESAVGFELTGKLIELLADEGDRVKKGAPLAVLDTQLLSAQRDEAAAGLARLEAERALAQRTLERTEAAFELNAVSEQQLDDAQESLAALNAALMQADASLQSAQVQIQKSRLLAPFDAVIAERHVDEGRIVNPSTSVLTLLEDSVAEARIGIAGDSIDHFEVGSTHTLVVQEKPIISRVKSILPTRDASSRSVDVIFEMDMKLSKLHQGDLVQLSIPRLMQESGIWLPFEALTESSRGLWAVYVVDELKDSRGIVKRYELELLHLDRDRVFVRGTWPDRSLVVVSGRHKLVPQQRVLVRQIDLDLENKPVVSQIP